MFIVRGCALVEEVALSLAGLHINPNAKINVLLGMLKSRSHLRHGHMTAAISGMKQASECLHQVTKARGGGVVHKHQDVGDRSRGVDSTELICGLLCQPANTIEGWVITTATYDLTRLSHVK